MADNKKDFEVFTSVITALAKDAAAKVEGVYLQRPKRKNDAVEVFFLPNEKVTVDIYVTLFQGYTVPETVANLQESVKNQIEDATKFKVHTVNVQVVGVEMESL